MDIEEITPLREYIYSDEQIIILVEDFIKSYGDINLNPSFEELNEGFKNMRRKYRIQPSKFQMRRIYNKYLIKYKINQSLLRWLIKRVMRSESGVTVVTIVTKPGDKIKFSCPEKCAYCPTETDLEGNPTQPKSYISSEPAMARAARNKFSIRDQIIDRIKSYVYTGNIQYDIYKKKIEVILSGGTWDVMPKEYRDSVINEMYYTFNMLSIGCSRNNNSSTPQVHYNEYRKMLSIEEEIMINETSIFGVIGLTIETRPDYVRNKTLIEYLEYGVTRVQLGGQSTHNDILLKIKRGCTIENMEKAIRLLKGIGMKVVTHWMPDLPGSSPEKDNQMFDRLINDPNLQCDDWKIYPCAVVKSHSKDRLVKSDIDEWYANKTYIPYSETNLQSLIDVCINCKNKINPWIRIQRLVRDIPTQSIQAGYNSVTNLREIIEKQMTKKNLFCKCIRCMEIKDKSNLINQGKLVVRKYKASGGIEYHITYELEKVYWNFNYIKYCCFYFINKLIGRKIYYEGNNNLYCGLFGFLRLRIDPNPGLNIIPELKNAGLIRELHVYGISTSVGNDNIKSSQHKGIGKLLMSTAEEIIKINKLNKAAVIAGVGVRDYYKNKCGYRLDKFYMIKYF
jgi:ELP3 family radical SAM enzyme/protein acetyltransferase